MLRIMLWSIRAFKYKVAYSSEKQRQASEMFSKTDDTKNFAKFTGERLCWSLFFNKVADFQPATLFKKKLQHRCYPVNFAKFLRTSFLKENLRWLLPKKHK